MSLHRTVRGFALRFPKSRQFDYNNHAPPVYTLLASLVLHNSLVVAMHLRRLSANFFAILIICVSSHAQDVMRVDINANDIARHLLRSRVQLPTQPGTFSFRHPEWIPGIHGPSEQIRNIAGLSVFDAHGTKLNWLRDPNQLTRFSVELSETNGDHIVVELVYLANQPTRVSTGVDSFGNADVLAINMNTCLVYPDGADLRKLPVDVTVEVPHSFRIASALRGANGIEDDTYAFDRTTVETLVDSPLIAGRNYRQLEVKIPDCPVTRYHFVSESPKALKFDDQWAGYYHNLMEEAFALFGSAPFEAYDFLVVCSDKIPGMGLEHHESSLNCISERALTDDEKKKGGAVYLLGHELVHAWCGKYRRPAGMYRPNFHESKQTGELWIYEGLTQYLGQILTARAGFLTFEEHLQRTASRVGYLANRAGRAWRPLEDTAVAAYTLRGGSPNWTDLRRSQDYYDEGAFFWMEADSIIRKKSQGARSLDDFCQQFFAYDKEFPKVKPFEVSEIVSTLNGLADYDWQGLIDRRIRTTADELSLEGIRTSGYDFQLIPEKPDNIKKRESERESIYVDFSIGLVLKMDGEISAVVPNSAADQAGLADGTKLLGVNGMKFKGKRLDEAIADSTTRKNIELLIEDGEAYSVVTVDYAAGPRFPALKRIVNEQDIFRAICSPKTE